MTESRDWGGKDMVIRARRGKYLPAHRFLGCTRVDGLQRVADELIAAGYTTLDKQAKVLGVQRSTAWTIVRVKHKLGRLSAKTSTRILANPDLPQRVRAAVEEYLAIAGLENDLESAPQTYGGNRSKLSHTI